MARFFAIFLTVTVPKKVTPQKPELARTIVVQAEPTHFLEGDLPFHGTPIADRPTGDDVPKLAVPAKPEPLEALLARMERVPKERHLESMKRFSSDPRDQATPVALVDLLAALDAGKLLDPEHTSRLLKWMRETPTGAAQLRAGLPPEVVLAHKTGQVSSLGFTVALNDVGIATGNGRRLAIAVLLTDVEAPLERCQAVIAEVGRTVWSELGAAAPTR